MASTTGKVAGPAKAAASKAAGKTAGKASSAAATGKPAKATRKRAAPEGFSRQERAAMRERAAELKAQARAGRKRQDGEAELLAAIKAMPEADRGIATGVHALVTATAPGLLPRTWYGMPAWEQEGKVLCFCQAAAKFGSRYATLGFSDKAALDDGPMWPTAFALVKLTPAVEKKIVALLKRALR